LWISSEEKKMIPSKTILKAVGFTLLTLAVINNVKAAAPVKKIVNG